MKAQKPEPRKTMPPANWFERLLIGVLILVILMVFVGFILRGSSSSF